MLDESQLPDNAVHSKASHKSQRMHSSFLGSSFSPSGGISVFFFKKENTGMVTEIDFACAKQIVQALALVAPTGSLVT